MTNIAKVTGSINGTEFPFIEAGGLWQATVPAVPDGQYIVELFAWDTAGNRAYLATVLFAFSIKDATCNMRFLHVSSDFRISNIGSTLRIYSHK